MKPQKQLIEHDPANDKWGDCLRTCVAMLLDVDATDVPHFAYGNPDPETMWQAVDDYVALFGLATLMIAYPSSLSVYELLENFADLNSDMYYMLGGVNRSGSPHIVVCYNNEIVGDPAWTNAGLVGPSDGAWFVITFIPLRFTKR